MSEPLVVDAAGAGELLGMSERLVRTLTAEGRLPSIDIGDHRNRLYSVEALRRWALEASGYTASKEGTTHGQPAATDPAERRTVVHRGPGRPRQPRSSRPSLPLRVVER